MLLALLALVLAACSSTPNAAAPATGSPGSAAPAPGAPAPPLVLPTLDGSTTVRLDELRGKVVLVNFWASWCEPCTREMPQFERWHEQYKDAGLVVLGVNTLYQNDRAAVEQFLHDNNITYPIVVDEDGDTTHRWLVPQLPRSYVVDRDGTVRFVKIGEFTERDFSEQVLPLLQ
jgi:peroxiredoxin